MQELSLRALRFFLALDECGTLAQASARVGISSTTGRTELERLRRHWGDPLFVPSGRMLCATAAACKALAAVRVHLGRMEGGGGYPFDPASSPRIFRMQVTDIGLLVMMPRVLRQIQTVSETISLSVADISASSADGLHSGEAELVIGFIPRIDTGFRRQLLTRLNYVCVARKGHPRLKTRMSLKDYLAERHVHIRAEGTGHGFIENYLRQRRICRSVALSVPSFASVGFIVSRTDLVATVPADMAQELVAADLCNAYDLPFPSAEFGVRQYWHPRSEDDPGHRWLRGLIRDAFAGSLRATPLRGQQKTD